MANLIEIFIKIVSRFQVPRNVKVIIFNEGGAEFLAKTVLAEVKYAVLPQRKGRFLSLGIVRRFLQHYKLILSGGRSLAIHKRLILLIGNARRVYLLACINQIAPKVVITYIDNDYDFQWLSTHSGQIVFIAIQNGVREDYDLSKWLPAAPHPARLITLPHYYCFGEYEVDLYKKHGHTVKQFSPVGSLRASYYLLNNRLGPQIKIDHEYICLISQWIPSSHIKDCLWSEFYPAFQKLCEYLNSYLKDKKISLVVALRSGSSEEKEYFSGIFGTRALLPEKGQDSMMSYRLIDSAAVTVTVDSTLGREAFSWGRRVLFCNLSEDQNYNFPIKGLWALEQATYKEFSNRLNNIFSVEADEFASLSKESSNYLMRNPKFVKAHEKIREHIDSVLLNHLSADSSTKCNFE